MPQPLRGAHNIHPQPGQTDGKQAAGRASSAPGQAGVAKGEGADEVVGGRGREVEEDCRGADGRPGWVGIEK